MSESGKAVVRMSVRAVVETTLHESDLSPAAGAAQRMQEGALAHRARQRTGAAQLAHYKAEAALEAEYEAQSLCLHVTGRADGLYIREDGTPVVEEIKLGAPDMPLIPAHMAQAAMYGHMLCKRDGYPSVCLCVLYVNAQGEPLARYDEERASDKLSATFETLCAAAAAWEEEKLARRQQRDASLCVLPFPFEAYRAGQRKFAANVYVAVRERKRLFAQAPTGIGKTMAALYPALRALGEGKCARIVFLTARTTGRQSALDAMERLHRVGADCMSVELTAKDKVCPQQARDCRPEVCPYASGYYDRLPEALHEALHLRLLRRDAIARLARTHRLCPFELALELSRLADVIVGDYNYVFDPPVACDSLLGAPGGAVLLVDEAHQLAPRVRDAYSSELSSDALRALRREVGRAHGRSCALYRALTEVISALKTLAETEEFQSGRLSAPPDALREPLLRLTQAASERLAQGGSAAAMDAFSLSFGYTFAAERFDERYAALTQADRQHAQLSLVCLNVAPEILAVSKRARGTVYFSATLAPFDASRRMLGSEDGDACLALPSPFDPAQLDASIAPLDIRYAAREQTAPQVAQAIADHLRGHAGHTLIFFPSYAYLERIAELLLGEDGLADTAFLRETRGMSEEKKNALLSALETLRDSRKAILCVLGGAFSEGVDLPGDRLKNVIIVSTGLPQPDARIRAMQAYYDGLGEDGFALCMTLPGMVRVIQAAGRLIRTHEDTGSLLLIDRRYALAQNRRLLCGTLIGSALGI